MVEIDNLTTLFICVILLSAGFALYSKMMIPNPSDEVLKKWMSTQKSPIITVRSIEVVLDTTDTATIAKSAMK